MVSDETWNAANAIKLTDSLNLFFYKDTFKNVEFHQKWVLISKCILYGYLLF